MILASPVERNRLPAWIGQRLGLQKQKAAPDILQFLADKVEGNLLAAHQEIKKLALLYPAGALSFNQVKDAVLDVARYDVFKLSDAMMTGDTTRYARILEGIAGRGDGAAIHCRSRSGAYSLADYHSWRTGFGQTAHATDESNQGMGRSTESNGKRSQPPRVSEQLVAALLHAAKIDRISKGCGAG